MIEVKREKLNINKLVAEKKETIFVEGDMIVPDSKPDVLNTICASGVVSLYKKEVLEEKFKIEGSINTYIMYVPEDGDEKVRGITTNLDFSETINIANAKEGMEGIVCINIKNIEAKVINGRKVGIKATLEICIKVYSNENIEIINETQDTRDIQVLKEELIINSLVGIGHTKIYAKENIIIDNSDDFAEILKIQMGIINKDIKISYNKVLTKAELSVNILYLTEDNRINNCNYNIPIVGFVDIQNVADGNICDVNYEIKNIIIKPNSQEEHSIYVEAEIGVVCFTYEEKNINLIQDMYSLTNDINFEKISINSMTEKQNKCNNCQIREIISIPETDGLELCDVDIDSYITNENKIKSKILNEGEMNLRFILKDSKSNIRTETAKIPFQYTIENLQNGDTINTNTELEVRNKDFIIQDGGKISCNIDLCANTDMYRTVSINMINSIEETERFSDQDYSVMLYIVKKGDTMWNIAKIYGSMVDDIARINGIENPDKIMPGQKIYIPKYSRVLEMNYE